MDQLTAPIDDLIAEACALVEHHTADVVTLTLVRDDLAAAVAACADPTTAADACAVVTVLDQALRVREPGHDLPLAS